MQFFSSEHEFKNVDPNKAIIRCICGILRDEDLIQCSKCMVWQHVKCMDANMNSDSYLCEQCDKRIVAMEIPLNECTNEGHRLYLTLMRGDLQIHQDDTVYLLRDTPITPGSVKRHTYKTIGKINYAECDIFRVERLWMDHKGNRFVSGHNYLRPHETFHEPSRKFYQNEVIRVPVYEDVPIDLIMGRCWVLDPTTFCKGRPVGCVESHVYIGELKMDKARKKFSKILKNRYLVCTKPYAFNEFVQKLKISRNCVVSWYLHFTEYCAFASSLHSDALYSFILLCVKTLLLALQCKHENYEMQTSLIHSNI